MRALVGLVLKETRQLLRDPGGLILLFLLPAVFVVALSVALQGAFTAGREEDKLKLAVVVEDEGALSARIVEGIEASGLFRTVEPRAASRAAAVDGLRAGRYDLVVVLPRAASRALRLEEEAQVDVLLDPVVSREVARATESIVRVATLAATIDQLRGRMEGMADDQRALGKTLRELEDAVRELDEKLKRIPQAPQLRKGKPAEIREPSLPAGKHLTVRQAYVSTGAGELKPSSVQQNVPGWTIFALFWMAQILALNLIHERTTGLYARISIAPISSLAYLVGKIVPFVVVNLLQAVAMFAVGVYLLPHLGCSRLELHDLGALALITACISVASLGFGLLLASLSRSTFLVASASSAALIIMTVLGGIMVPRYIMPAFMQRLAHVVPQGWAIDGYQKVLIKGYSAVQVLPEAGALLAFGAGFVLLALVRLRIAER